MSRKPKRGYFVRGQFVAEGSELDLELKRQSKGDTETSKTDLKRESAALQDLGEQLLTLRADLMQPLALSDKLLEKEYLRLKRKKSKSLIINEMIVAALMGGKANENISGS